jgi:ferredoxin-NADP reductase/predicted pyridoxine 5'-phosphate oxidase superfamily flavin-nucleotide-binding protein
MPDSSTSSPFHRGEHEIQERLGVREQIEDVGKRFIRGYMPDEHRTFYAQLPFLLIGSVDNTGRPWASVLIGRPGFVHSTTPDRLKISTRLIYGDPLKDSLSPGAQVGLLGIEYESRRRNRMNGKLAAISDDGFEIEIDQAFGNCPQYIQSRGLELLPEIDSIGETRPVQAMKHLDDRARQIISRADNFYIATHYSEEPDDASHGTDVSHRGGKPGFVLIEDDRTITFPDYSGNYHFNTIGNLMMNPLAGLLFIDFMSGDLLYLTCKAEIIWDSEERHAFDGAERLVRFTLDEGVLVGNAMPIRWNFMEYSPSLEKTGSWEEVDEIISARKKGNIYQEYQVIRIEQESKITTSFYLQPVDGDGIHCHKAGQFLPVEIQPPGVDEPINRTYTISNAPNGSHYRLSIKRETPAKPGLPPGVSSNYFHDHVKLGTKIRAMSPRGKFTLEDASTRPVVLISGGVGVTPMISMLEQLDKDRKGCGCSRQVWFIHGSQNSEAHAFGGYVRSLANNWPCLCAHVRYSRPLDSDVEGKDYDSIGRVDIELLKSLLSLDDYEFYLCGPSSFMGSIFDGLKSLNISDERIHYEFFGPGATLHKERPGSFESLVGELGDREPVTVQFARSGIEARWDPSKGSLLDLAESEGLQPAYSCRSGICQTCATRIVSGSVDYLESPMAQPEKGDALICCSYPRVQKDADDVAEKIILDL